VLIASAANFLRSISANSLSADLIRSSHLMRREVKIHDYSKNKALLHEWNIVGRKIKKGDNDSNGEAAEKMGRE
jgi:hypothetical protein